MILNTYDNKISGLVRDLNPGPLAPKARIIPLDQRATAILQTHAVTQSMYVRTFKIGSLVPVQYGWNPIAVFVNKH